MLEIERSKVEVKLYGEVYDMTKPSVKQAQSFGKKLQKASDVESIGIIVDILDGCGLPRAVAEEMEVGHLKQLVDVIMPSKK